MTIQMSFQELMDASSSHLRTSATGPAGYADGVYLQSHAGNCIHAKKAFLRNWEQFWQVRNIGKSNATKRGTSTLPLPAQSCSPSPYVDMALFSYDDRHISPYDRLKQYTENPLHIYSRDTHRIKFSLIPQETDHSQHVIRARRFISWVFHPTDPLIFSIQWQEQQPISLVMHFRHVD